MATATASSSVKADDKTTSAASKAAKPVQTFRLRGVSVSIFANPVQKNGNSYCFHKARVQRTYKDGATFKRTSGLDRDDLPVAIHLMEKAWKYILETESGETASE